MDWVKWIVAILSGVAAAAIPVCAAFLVQFLRRKSEQIGAQTDSLEVKKLLAEVTDAVTTAVTYTSQTYVDALKNAGAFTLEAQKEAAQKALTACIASISPAAQAFIEVAYGDLTEYLTTKIEAEVRKQKIEAPLTIGLPVLESGTDTTAIAASTAAATAATISQTAISQLNSEPAAPQQTE